MIGLIGGTGTYDPKLLKKAEKKKIRTPFGFPSDLIITGEYEGKKIAIIPRHGEKHTINPSNVNYRANIWAMKQLGVTKIFSFTTVGSLQEELHPGTLVFLDQFIDRTYDRKRTFFDEKKVCHISVAEPFCPELRKLLIEEAKKMNIEFREKGTYVCVEGPRFSTKAESLLYKSWGADVVGMTLCPEVVLAREAEICYANIAMVTDYDTFKEKTVDWASIVKTAKENSEKVRELLNKAILRVPERNCGCGNALKNALI